MTVEHKLSDSIRASRRDLVYCSEMPMVRNPWGQLPLESPYVLPADGPHLDAFNLYVGRRHPQYRLDLNRLPEPFGGNRQAPLVVLSRNPGITKGDRSHLTGEWVERVRANLGPDRRGHVHLYLLPQFAKTSGGDWWRGCFKALAAGGGWGDLADRVLFVEFHGYHSQSWRALPLTLPSQRYSFWLVEQAMERGAVIVLMRGMRDRKIAVPGLIDYQRLVEVKNPRRSTISRGNCKTRRDFELVQRALDGD